MGERGSSGRWCDSPHRKFTQSVVDHRNTRQPTQLFFFAQTADAILPDGMDSLLPEVDDAAEDKNRQPEGWVDLGLQNLQVQ